MLLIQTCLRWLTPVSSGIESPAAPAATAQPATQKVASRHHIGLAPIHAPPLRLSSFML